MPTQFLNLTTTPKPFILCDDVIICGVGLSLLIMINTMLFSVEFPEEFPNKKWSRGGLNALLQKIDKFGYVEHLDLAGSGRPWSTHNAENIKYVQSQEDSEQPLFCQKDSIKAHISRSSVHNIVEKDLQIGLKYMLYFFCFL